VALGKSLSEESTIFTKEEISISMYVVLGAFFIGSD
jgi:hypothetical protein